MHRNPDEFIPTRKTLLSRLRNVGDDRSWQEFFDTYSKLIYRMAIRAGLNDADAQDIVQVTVLSVTHKIKDFVYDPEVGSFKGWLLKKTRWLIRDLMRKHGPPADDQPADDHGWIPPPAHNGEIEAFWDAEYEQALLDGATAIVKRKVKAQYYQIFEMVELRGRDAKAVARMMELPPHRVWYACRTVRAAMQSEVKRLRGGLI